MIAREFCVSLLIMQKSRAKHIDLNTMERFPYDAPAVRVVDARLELSFLLSGGDGDIDPGTDDPWGDF